MSIADNREDGGKLIRQEWIRWAQEQPNPKPSWLIEWKDLDEPDKEVDRRIWEVTVAPYITAIAGLNERVSHLQDELNTLYWEMEGYL